METYIMSIRLYEKDVNLNGRRGSAKKILKNEAGLLITNIPLKVRKNALFSKKRDQTQSDYTFHRLQIEGGDS
jgi:hypothetical protein